MTSNRTNHAAAGHPDRSGGDGNRVLTLGGLAAVALSLATSALGYGLLPSRVRIHWSLGLGPYYGPEFAPKLAVLALFPVLVAGAVLGGRLLAGRLRSEEAFAAVRPYYALAVLVTLAALLVGQVALVAANV